jgi:hypothetical protein
VVAGIPPEPTNLRDIEALFPRETADGAPLLAGDDLALVVLRLRACKDAIAANESLAEALEYEVKRAMQGCSELVLPNGKSAIDWKTRDGSYLNQSALKEAHPAIVKAFTEKRPSRVFRVKAFDTKGL